MKRRFDQLDVFTAEALRGNPLAVVHDAAGLDDERMAAFARWTNLSETTFLLPPTDPAADYRVRIFTPGGELPFAGHPTLGSCQAWLAAGGQPKHPGSVVQQCGVGLVSVRRDDRRLAFAAPPLHREPVPVPLLAELCQALGLEPAQVRASADLDNGLRWRCLLLDSAHTVLGLRPDLARLKGMAHVGVIAPQPPGADSDFEVRAFLPALGVDEDPVTGGLNAALAQWLTADGLAPAAYVAAQGAALGRAGRVHVHRDGNTLWIGGEVSACIDGEVQL
jgi:PhzF family phenazine biosynthesis protein